MLKMMENKLKDTEDQSSLNREKTESDSVFHVVLPRKKLFFTYIPGGTTSFANNLENKPYSQSNGTSFRNEEPLFFAATFPSTFASILKALVSKKLTIDRLKQGLR